MSTTCSDSVPHGVGTFDPGAKFSFPRSYVSSIVFGLAGWTAAAVDVNVWNLTSILFPLTYVHVVMRPNFYDWSSNSYTLDYPICESWYSPGGIGMLPADYRLVFRPRNDLAGWELLYLNDAFLFDISGVFALPGPPPTYWLPPLN